MVQVSGGPAGPWGVLLRQAADNASGRVSLKGWCAAHLRQQVVNGGGAAQLVEVLAGVADALRNAKRPARQLRHAVATGWPRLLLPLLLLLLLLLLLHLTSDARAMAARQGGRQPNSAVPQH